MRPHFSQRKHLRNIINKLYICDGLKWNKLTSTWKLFIKKKIKIKKNYVPSSNSSLGVGGGISSMWVRFFVLDGSGISTP